MKTLKQVQGDGTEMNGAIPKSLEGDFKVSVRWTDQVKSNTEKNSKPKACANYRSRTCPSGGTTGRTYTKFCDKRVEA